VKISRVRIENYRVHRDTTVDLKDLTAFIGRNGAGKSSILYAIGFFYEVAGTLTLDDIHAGSDAEAAVTVTYSGLSDAEIEAFGLYVRGDRLTVIKRASAGQPGRYYGVVPQIPEFAEVRALSGAQKQIDGYRALREREDFSALPPARSQGDVAKAMDAFEEDPANAGQLQDLERPEQFFGHAHAGAGRLDNYTSFVLVPAVHEAADETGKRGAIQVLVDSLVTSALASRADIVGFRSEFEERFKQVYAPENLTEIDRVTEAVNDLLGNYAPGVALRLNWQEAVPPTFGLPAFRTRLGDDAYDTPIALQGHGMQRALVLSLLQLMASQRGGVAADGDDSPAVAPDLIIAIEEPELYLHPAQCRYLAALLAELAAGKDSPRVQVMYATHSPYFVRIDRFEQICAIRRRALSEDDVPCCEVGRLSFESIRGEIARVADMNVDDITRDSFIARCASVMDVVASEGLFASVAIVVEGYGEVGCLRVVADQLALRWDARGIVIVPARSKNNIDRPVHIFRGLGIPCYFVFDGDASHRGNRDEADAVRSNRLLLRLAGVPPEDFPTTRIEGGWAVFEDRLEAELRAGCADPSEWKAVREAVRDELGFDSVKQALKNPDGAAAVTRELYQRGRTLPNLEAVAKRVTVLAGGADVLAMGSCVMPS
jgi:putative ATP-dependent endonuclease of OLD family